MRMGMTFYVIGRNSTGNRVPPDNIWWRHASTQMELVNRLRPPGSNFTLVTPGRNLSGVTANLFRLAELVRRIIFASVIVPVFLKLSGFVPGVPLRLKTRHRAFATVVWSEQGWIRMSSYSYSLPWVNKKSSSVSQSIYMHDSEE